MGLLMKLAIETAMRLGELCSLNYEIITRMASKLANVLELAAVTRHKDLKMLQRYYNPDPTDLAQKLG